MTWNLFIDDERTLQQVDWMDRDIQVKYQTEEFLIARNHQQVIDLIEEHGFPNFVSFDHDLGDPVVNGDGYMIAKYLVDLDMCAKYKMPDDFDYCVHSKNPIGKLNIQGYLDGYRKHRQDN